MLYSGAGMADIGDKTVMKRWEEQLIRSRFRLTSARRAIYRILDREKHHLTVDEIYWRLHDEYPRIGLTTIYRTLNVLADIGLACKLDFGDGRARFEALPGSSHHHHLICTQCRKVYDYSDFVDEELHLIEKTEKKLEEKFGFRIQNHTINFYGLCGACRSACQDGKPS